MRAPYLDNMTTQTLHRRNFLLHLQERPTHDAPVLLKEPAHKQLTSAQIAQLHNEQLITWQPVDIRKKAPYYFCQGYFIPL